jgi:enamine deaminase RidA (YjgF/YER057c/UK114 family)
MRAARPTASKPDLKGGPNGAPRIRKFNTKDTYYEQKLDNDPCRVVVAKGRRIGQGLETSKSVGVGDVAAQTEQAMKNIKILLAEAGSSLQHICKIIIYIIDRRYREAVHRGVGRHLKGVFPVSTGIVAAALARPECLVEADAIAVIPD